MEINNKGPCLTSGLPRNCAQALANARGMNVEMAEWQGPALGEASSVQRGPE